MKYFDCDYNLFLFFLASIFKWFLCHSIFTQTFIGTLNFEFLSFLIEFVTSSFDFIFIAICGQTQFLLIRGLILHICPIFLLIFGNFNIFSNSERFTMIVNNFNKFFSSNFHFKPTYYQFQQKKFKTFESHRHHLTEHNFSEIHYFHPSNVLTLQRR